jgi:hypothetical protein
MQKFAKIDVATNGDSTIVAAVANKRIRVLAYTFITDTDTIVTFKSASTEVSGPMAIAATGGIAASIGQLGTGGMGTFGLLETEPGQALVLNLSDVANLGGHCTYYLV